MTMAPFLMGNLNGGADPEGYQSHTGNAGVSLGFNVPLDRNLIELCKERAKVETERQRAEADKARLDFELVRLIKCGEAMKMGVTFHPTSPYAKICSDVVVRYPPVKQVVEQINANTENPQ
jgi:hypothetical protein